MAILYRHLKPCGEVFYIGIGKEEKRAYEKYGRNKFWNGIVKKYEYEVQILKSDLTWEDAKKMEIILIDYYGRRNLEKGTLVNLTDGGEGALGVIMSEEHKQKLRDAKLGIKLSETHKQNLSRAGKNKEKKGRKVICTETLKIWNSIADCEEELGYGKRVLENKLNPNNIKCKNNTSIEYLDLYEKGEVRERTIIDGRLIGKPWTEERKDKYLEINTTRLVKIGKDNYKSRSVINIDTLEIYETATEVAKHLNIKRTTLCTKFNNGYKTNDTNFVYYDDYLTGEFKINQELKKLKIIWLETGEEFKSLAEACRITNIGYKRAHAVINDTGKYIKNNITLIKTNP